MEAFKKGLAGLLILAGLSSGCGSQKDSLTEKAEECIPSQKKEESLYSYYRENIFYKDLSKIDFNEWTEYPKKIPESFLDALKNPIIKDKETFQQLVLDEALKLGYAKEEICKLDAYPSIKLAVEITANRIAYVDVDNDPEFLKQYSKSGFDLGHDELFRIGKGDCDKYTMITVGILNFFKELNPNLAHLYFSDNFGINEEKMSFRHQWTSIICMYKNKIILSQIDPTFYDNGDKLEAKIGWHVPKDEDNVRALFYTNMGEYDAAFSIYQKALTRYQDSKKREVIYRNCAFLSYMARDPLKMEEVRKNYSKEGLTGVTDNILYYSFRLEEHAGNHKKANEFKQRLIDEFPNSFWAKILK